jgi:hypothetical protein
MVHANLFDDRPSPETLDSYISSIERLETGISELRAAKLEFCQITLRRLVITFALPLLLARERGCVCVRVNGVILTSLYLFDYRNRRLALPWTHLAANIGSG